MIIFLLGIVAGYAILLVVCLAGGCYLLATTPPEARRKLGRCAVPGCQKPARHWKR